MGYGNYLNMAVTEAAFGDATQYAYTQNILHEMMRNCLYQYCGSKGVDETGNALSGPVGASTSSSGVPVGAVVLGVVAVVLVAGVAIAVAVKCKKKKAGQ